MPTVAAKAIETELLGNLLIIRFIGDVTSESLNKHYEEMEKFLAVPDLRILYDSRKIGFANMSQTLQYRVFVMEKLAPRIMKFAAVTPNAMMALLGKVAFSFLSNARVVSADQYDDVVAWLKT